MGLIGTILGSPAATGAIGTAVTSVAEVFTPNATKKMEAAAAAWQAALAEHGAEFQHARPGFFDRFVNGLNRLPRPMLALGTLGLFVYAMIDPTGFETRMVGLNAVPEPLWWLLGAIVGFYFGAREFHYNRIRSTPAPVPAGPAEDNPALSEFLSKGAAGAAPAA
ncbi:holin family protein [Rhodobacter capsulatus]|uniref:holin family protein n=1 Tax=Rhodobacter capsulatus TaxID=1061 RepID=UPI0003D2A5B9|nr:holin family protein [Rhodobacter capsulatus]ETD88449.1 hypothetical protein U713_14005 [Rhodobacter capsulatus YW2]